MPPAGPGLAAAVLLPSRHKKTRLAAGSAARQVRTGQEGYR
ncbi:hypothetical protein ISE1_1248 [plant metagenome]|uniref:Uncharacterized protein n=1 Tax=plant metagenome TaxID=1297885 RepID=A0A484VCY5_9ZZZZ